jgi:excisionase family DNA binding protein
LEEKTGERRRESVRHYYAAIRRYRTNEDLTFEGLQAALDSLLPLIREKVVAYYVLEAGDGVVASITICEDEEKLEATNRVATEWLKQYLASSIVSQQEVPNISLEVGQTLKGALYEAVSEPAHRRSLQLLSVQEVGELLGMGRSWVYQQLKSGELPSVKLRGAVKVKREDLEEYINTNRRG